MSLDDLLKEMGACGSARRLWVEWCDDSIRKAAETLVRMMCRPEDGVMDARFGVWWLKAHICNAELSAQLMVLDEIERAVRKSIPHGVDVDDWVAGLRRDVRNAEDKRFVHWTAVMGRRRVS